MHLRDLTAAIRVVAIARAGTDRLEHAPRRATRRHGGDAAYLVGPYEEVLGVLRRAAGTPPAGDAAQADGTRGRHSR